MEPEIVKSAPLLDKDDYYKDIEYVTFSHIKLFDSCETLYRDTYITKVYEEGDKDYFTYGKLVDALLSEPEGFIAEHFMRVERKIKVEDALKYENEIKELEAYITAPDFLAKLEKGNQTALKGLEKRKKEIEEAKNNLDVIASLADKIQVTNALWEEAHETALGIKTHPSFAQFEWSNLTSQQLITAEIKGVKRKGRLDHLKLSPEIHKIYAIFRAGKMTKQEMQEKIKALNPNDHWAIITDIKTCYSLEKLEPFNDHYLGQLAYYQDLVSDFFGVPVANIKVRILAGDKQSNKFKMAELFTYNQSDLDAVKPKQEELCNKIVVARHQSNYVSDKAKRGMGQTCFKCTECRHCPFSVKPGEAVLVAGPRFGKRSSSAETSDTVNEMDSSGLY